MEELTISTKKLVNVELKDHTAKIKTAGTNIRKNFLKIAHQLNEIDKTECYLDDGFENAIDYAGRVLGMGKSTAYNFIKIAEDFIDESGERTILTDKGADYGCSQLQALLTIGAGQAKELHDAGEISPDMSVRKIKEVVKSLTTPPDEDEPIETSAEVVEEFDEPDEIFASVDFLGDMTILVHGDVDPDFVNDLNKLYQKYYG